MREGCFISQYYTQPFPLIVLATLHYIVEYPTCQLYFLDIHTRLEARVYAEKIQTTHGIFNGHTAPKRCITSVCHDICRSRDSTL